MRITKEQAIGILDGLGYDPFRTDLERVEALATAGAFTDGAGAARIAELERSNEQLRKDRVNLVAAAIADERLRRGLAGVEAVAKDWPEWKLKAAAEDFPIGEPSRPVATQPRVYLLVGARCGVVRVYFAKDAAEARRDELNADPFIAPGTPDPDAPYEMQSWEVESSFAAEQIEEWRARARDRSAAFRKRPEERDPTIYRASRPVANGVSEDGLRPSSQCPTQPERDAYERALKYLRDFITSFDQTDLDCLTTLILEERAEAVAESRPVAAGSKAHGSETWDEAQDRLYRERHPEQFRHVAACSKAWAEEIRAVLFPATGNNRRSVERLATQKLIDYLDRAGFFADEATLAEIAEAAREVEERAAWSKERGSALVESRIALRLATAVRKLGIGGGK